MTENGLSNVQQAWLQLVAGILFAISIVSVPAGLNAHITVVFALLGAVAMAIKEYLGISVSSVGPDAPTTTGSNVPAPIAPTVTWQALQALEGTAAAGPEDSVTAVAENPVSLVTWYAVVDDTGHVQLTNINPAS
jgi:hypothetical protein